MTGASTLASLFDAYVHDLESMVGVVDHGLVEDPRPAPLLGKLCMEVTRVVVYEQHFLLPALRELGPEGVEVARAEGARLDDLLGSARVLAATDIDDPRLDDVFDEIAARVRELADWQRRVVWPLTDRLDPDLNHAWAQRVTPSLVDGPSHSHPIALKRYDGLGWPRPEFVDAARDAFTAEVRNREPGLTTLR